MIGFTIFLHTLVCVGLMTIILMQSGRGGGLTEAFASAESMFGAQTNSFLIKATTVFSTLFLITCLSLAVLSTKRSKSLMSNKVAAQAQTMPMPDVIPVTAEPEAQPAAQPTDNQ